MKCSGEDLMTVAEVAAELLGSKPQIGTGEVRGERGEW
jgi:hypothetical protein